MASASSSNSSVVGSKPLPSSYTTHQLGPIDHQLPPFIPVACIYLYRHPIDSLKLRNALAVLLDTYPHLTGRIGIRADGAPEVERIGTGVDFITATWPEDIELSSSTVVTDLPDGGNALLAPFAPSTTGPPAVPILSIQHTSFPNGAVALGIRVLHCCCDAAGYFLLVRHLAEVYRTGGIAEPPVINSFLAEVQFSDEEREEVLSIESSGSSVTETQPTFVPPTSPPAGRILRFTKSELEKIKAAATPSNGWISTFDALSALIYQRIYRARCSLGQTNATAFLSSIDQRAASRLNFPPNYFPNGITAPTFELAPSELADAPLSTIATRVHDFLRSEDSDHILSMLKWFTAQPNKSKSLSRFPVDRPGFMISQWTNVKTYEGVSFEDEDPLLVATPFTPISLLNGLAYTLPRKDGDGLELAIALSENVWEVLDRTGGFEV
ncbi:transferase [Leucosporidium creatinivorum]|uniref:Transferase n=1 Tax=Leucosporidium creatinivorum TaxID=106004 RepID=A0A1Y2FGA5_9BASI|nr:transferase [Leucosporidium creatinivorum]